MLVYVILAMYNLVSRYIKSIRRGKVKENMVRLNRHGIIHLNVNNEILFLSSSLTDHINFLLKC